MAEAPTFDLDQRQPRERNSPYMGWISRLPCVACYAEGKVNRQVQVCHLRAGSLEHGKRPTGLGEKPSDQFTLSLCHGHHTGDIRVTKRSQHQQDELAFWDGYGINPFDLCIALQEAYRAGTSGFTVIAAFVARAKKERQCAE